MVILLIAVCFFPSILRANTLHETLITLNKTYDQAESISADFSQTVRFSGFDTESISTGKVFLQREKMRWDYVTPERQQIFVDGNTILHYVPEQQQIIKSHIGRQTGLPIDLFASMGKIEALFHISESGPATASSPATANGPATPSGPATAKNKNEIILTPKALGSQVTRMVLTLIPAPKVRGLLIQKVALTEENGNQSFFVFKDFQMNKTFRENPFLFNVPKGVEIIEMP